jgi:hypothetical protein
MLRNDPFLERKEAGIVIPFGQPDATQLKLDWLRDMIAEFSARPAERRGEWQPRVRQQWQGARGFQLRVPNKVTF